MNKITVLFPGGFKPLTGAHLDLANRYAQNSEVERVILLIGPKERDGITREKTIELFNILNDNSKIVIQPTEFNSPIMAAYEYLFALPPDATGRYAMAASAKGDDYVRAKDFVPNVDKYATIGDKKGRMIPKGIDAIELSVNVDPLMYPNQQPVSATMVRQSLATDDYETFRMSYPQYSEAKVKNAWQILKNMAESAFTQEWWTNELQEDVDDVIESMMFPAEKKRHSDKIKKLRSFLDANNDQSFVYDFDKFNKTVFGAKLQESALTENYITREELQSIEHTVDKFFAEYGIDVNFQGQFTHFIERLNESKNIKSSITLIELIQSIKEQDRRELLTCGGAAGHMAHPWDDHGLTFNDVREIVSRALEGRLDIEQAVTEKTDGQNIQVTWKNGEPGFARNKGTIINPMTTPEFIAEFEAKHQKTIAAYGAAAGEGYQLVVDAFRTCAEDLTAALNKVPAERLNQIFKNGRVFANMEIIYPATRNVIAYEKAHLQFHNLVEYDDSGNTVETDLTGGALMQSVISDANAHMQKTFSFIPPQKIKLGRVYNFEDQQDAFFNEIDQLEQKFNLKDTDLLSDYHKEWWRDVISTQAKRLNYNIPESILNVLIYRWAFEDKSTNISALKKQIESPEFAQWVTEFDKTDFKKYRKQNLEPFESIFLRLGVLVLQNATNFLAANPSKVVQQIKTELADLIKDLQKTNNQATLDKLKLELKRIERLGGFESIVPAEGVVFTYRGNTYKLTGAFAPINQILGVLKYAR